MSRLPITGLLHVTGEPDSGKTSFALECGVPPERMAFLDSDVKGRATAQQLKDAGFEFKLYRDMITATKGMREIEIFQAYMKVLDAIKPGEVDALVWDTFTEFENTLKPQVSKNPRVYREFYSPQGTIKGSEEWSASFDLEAEVLAGLLEKVPLVILISHLKPYRVGGKAVEGKFIPQGKSPLVTKTLFRLWLRRNPAGPVPIGLVMKRLNKKVVENGRIRTVNVLPLKIVPFVGHQSLWDTIEWYWNNPVGDAKPAPDQIPNEYEQSCLDGSLTEDQRMAVKLAMLEAQEDAASLQPASGTFELPAKEEEPTPPAELTAEQVAQVLAAKAEGKNMNMVAKELGVTLPMVLRAVKAANGNGQG